MVEGFKHTEIGFYPVDWVEDKLENVVTVLTDFTANGSFASLAQNVKYLDKPDHARLVRLTDIRASFKNDAIYISKEAYNFLAKSKLYGNELLLANVGAYAGYSFLYPMGLPFKGSLGPNMFLIKFNEELLNPQFAFLSFISSTILKQLLTKAASSAQPKLNKQNVRECLICFPPTKVEQTAIATALNDADALIIQLEKLIAKKKAIKQGAMQELLKTREGWEVKKLGEVGSFKNGINKSADDFGFGFPFINLMDVFGKTNISSNLHLGLLNSNVAERKMYDLRKGDVVFIRSSVKPEGVGLTCVIKNDLADTVFSGFIIRFRDSGTLSTEFKEYCFYSYDFRNRIISSSTVSANTNINQVALKDLTISFPKEKSEQTRIAQILSDMDAEIEGLEKKLEKTKKIKQGMMQELLTGRIRLI